MRWVLVALALGETGYGYGYGYGCGGGMTRRVRQAWWRRKQIAGQADMPHSPSLVPASTSALH
jgi:hypothetical protein